MNTVVIPCFNRPEFLFFCIAQIKLADQAAENHYIFKADYGYDPNISRVIKDFPYSHELAAQGKTIYCSTFRRGMKQSYNVLDGLIRGAKQSSGLVFLIEEDIMIGKDFFTFHKTVHDSHPEIFCSLSTANHNRIVYEDGSHDEYYLSHLDYCSLGVCYKKEIILNLIAPHAINLYFSNPMYYLTKRFPQSRIGRGFAEQDGLIRRIQESLPQFPTLYPHVPRAYHSGFYGYNRKQLLCGSLESKIEIVGDTIFSDQKMREVAVQPSYYEDSRPVDLVLPPWEQLKCKPINLEANALKL